eukprot:c27135_g1_i1 orf=71-325(+)
MEWAAPCLREDSRLVKGLEEGKVSTRQGMKAVSDRVMQCPPAANVERSSANTVRKRAARKSHGYAFLYGLCRSHPHIPLPPPHL